MCSMNHTICTYNYILKYFNSFGILYVKFKTFKLLHFTFKMYYNLLYYVQVYVYLLNLVLNIPRFSNNTESNTLLSGYIEIVCMRIYR